MKVTVLNVIDDLTFKASAVFLKKHPVYHKYVRISKTYVVHSNGKPVNVGDNIEIVNSRPISKNKKWAIK